MLSVGDKAPDFTGIDQAGNTVSLAQFAGKRLILYFYPKDNTSAGQPAGLSFGYK